MTKQEFQALKKLIKHVQFGDPLDGIFRKIMEHFDKQERYIKALKEEVKQSRQNFAKMLTYAQHLENKGKS